MRRLAMPVALLGLLLATACTRSPSSTSPSVAVAPNVPGVPAVSSVGWTRPMDVAPLTDPHAAAATFGGKTRGGEGTFDIISDTPWPGEKVRVFFFGVQT